jgi:hypothetical protein
MEAVRKLLAPFHHKSRSGKCDLFFGAPKCALFPEATVRKSRLRIFPNSSVVYRCLESSS